MSEITEGITIGVSCGLVIFAAEKISNYIVSRKTAIRNFKETFNALLVVFDDNCFGFPLGAEEFLADVYHAQLKTMLRTKAVLLFPGKRRSLQGAWNEYYKYIANNHFSSWLDSKNRIDPNDTATGSFKGETKERIQKLLNSI